MSDESHDENNDPLGMEGFSRHMDDVQTSLQKVSSGMELLANSAIRQGQDTENLAAHILAIETMLTVVLRQIPVDIAEVRAEAERRSMNSDGTDGSGKSMVVSLCEDILKRADD